MTKLTDISACFCLLRFGRKNKSFGRARTEQNRVLAKMASGDKSRVTVVVLFFCQRLCLVGQTVAGSMVLKSFGLWVGACER